MKIKLKNQLHNIIGFLCEIHNEILQRNVDNIQESLRECQQAAIVIGETIEKEVPREVEAVSLLERYCEELYYLSQEEIILQEVIDRLNYLLTEVNNRIKKMQTTYQVVFFPYKAEMWDSMESIWLACKEDKRCEAIVIPIPYYRYDADKKETVPFYDGDKFPEYVPIVSYLEYSLQNEMPDVAYIHNPYDKGNFVTSVHPAFYSNELKKYVKKLVYVPYYVTRGRISRSQSLLPVYLNMDYMIVQSEHFIKKNKHMFYYNRTKALGSPKLDKAIRLCKEKELHLLEYPREWKKVLENRKVLLLNTSISIFLQQGEVYLQKLFYIFNWIQSYKNIAIIWRPHPLLEATIHSLRQELLPKYRALISFFENEHNGILDKTADVSRAVAIADGYIGEEDSSMVCLFGAVGKPQFLLNNYINKNIEQSWKRRIRISDMISHNGKYYLTTTTCNGLFSVEENWEEIEYKGRAEAQPKWCGNYPYLCAVDNQIIMSPNIAFESGIYDCEEESIKKITPSVCYVEDKQFLSCRQLISYKNKIFYLPEKSRVIWEYNMSSKRWNKHEQCIKVFRDKLELENYQDLADIIDCVQDGYKLYMVTACTNRVLCFNMENGTYELYRVGAIGYGYSAITGSNGVFWLAEIQTGKILKWSLKTNETVEIEMPKGFGCFKRYDMTYYVHHRLLDMGEWIVSTPAGSNNMVKLNKETGEVSLCRKELWSEADIPANDYHPSHYFVSCFAKKKDDTTFWVQRTRDDALIEFNVVTEEYQIHYPTMTEESLERLLQNEDGFERWNKDWYAFGRRESRLFSLEDFIEDFVSGKLESVREKQMEELKDFAANMDGTCGEKVHQFMMSVLEKEEKNN